MQDLKSVCSHKRSLVNSRRSAPPPLPLLPPWVSVGGPVWQEESETRHPGKRRGGVIEHEVSGVEKEKCVQESEERKKKKKKKKRKQEEGLLDPFRSASVVATVGEEQNAGQDSTVRPRCKKTGSRLKPPAFLCSATDHAAKAHPQSPGGAGGGVTFHITRPELVEHIVRRNKKKTKKKSFRKRRWCAEGYPRSSGAPRGANAHLPAESGARW